MSNIESKLYSKSTVAIAIYGAILYFSISSVYLWVSTILASSFSATLSSLRSIELIKGTLFMLVNALIFGLIFWLIVEKLRKRRLKIVELEEHVTTLDRRALIGTFTSTIAHDMRNMISGADGWLSILEENIKPTGESKDALEMLKTSFRELITLTERLTSASQEDSEKRVEAAEPFIVINRTLDLISKHARLQGKQIQREFHGDNSKLMLDLSLFQQMLINLILNSADAAGENCTIKVVAKKMANKLYIEIHDNGPGIPQTMRENIFDPYSSTKTKGRGLGLLSLKVCVDRHNGQVQIEDSPLGGALFKIEINSLS